MFSKISQKTQENNCGRFSFLIKVAGLRHVFSCEFGKIFRNTFFTEHLRATAFEENSSQFSGKAYQ